MAWRVERVARPLLPAARRKHFAQRTQTVKRTPRLPPRRQMPDAGRVGQRAGRPFHPAPAVSAAAHLSIWITLPALVPASRSARRSTFIACLSGCVSICAAKASAKLHLQNRGHAERSSVAGEGGGGTESKHPARAPVASGRQFCIPRDPSTACRPAFARAALAQDDLRFCQPTGSAWFMVAITTRVSPVAPFF